MSSRWFVLLAKHEDDEPGGKQVSKEKHGLGFRLRQGCWIAGILCDIWNENANHFIPTEISDSLSCSGEIRKLPSFTGKGLVSLPKGSVWPLPRHGFVRAHCLLPHVEDFCLAGGAPLLAVFVASPQSIHRAGVLFAQHFSVSASTGWLVNLFSCWCEQWIFILSSHQEWRRLFPQSVWLCFFTWLCSLSPVTLLDIVWSKEHRSALNRKPWKTSCRQYLSQ